MRGQGRMAHDENLEPFAERRSRPRDEPRSRARKGGGLPNRLLTKSDFYPENEKV